MAVLKYVRFIEILVPKTPFFCARELLGIAKTCFFFSHDRLHFCMCSLGDHEMIVVVTLAAACLCR